MNPVEGEPVFSPATSVNKDNQEWFAKSDFAANQPASAFSSRLTPSDRSKLLLIRHINALEAARTSMAESPITMEHHQEQPPAVDETVAQEISQDTEEPALATAQSPIVQEPEALAEAQQSPHNEDLAGPDEGQMSRGSTMFDASTNSSRPKSFKVLFFSLPLPLVFCIVDHSRKSICAPSRGLGLFGL